jgi:hypothetical protein
VAVRSRQDFFGLQKSGMRCAGEFFC